MLVMLVQVGIDEAGRGCWAGPLVAAAVVLAKPVAGLADSKQLSRQQRERLDGVIRREAAGFGIGSVSPGEVDELGLTAATTLAMTRAMHELGITADEIIIDGNLNYLPGVAGVRTLVKADSLIPSVSAASVLAKVTRDNYMRQAALEFPNYQFDKHVGYGTALHAEMLKVHGPCSLHRLSYEPLKRLLIVKT